MTRSAVAMLFAVLTTLVVSAGQGPSPELLLKAAIQREEIDSDPAGAIGQYQAIVDRHPGDRTLVAGALLRIAGCYETLGRVEPDARQRYERLVVEFKDVPAVLAQARARLAVISPRRTPTGAAANPFPAIALDGYLRDVTDIVPSPDGRWLLYLRPSQRNPDVLSDSVIGRIGVVNLRNLSTGKEIEIFRLEPPDQRITGLSWRADSQAIEIDTTSTELEHLIADPFKSAHVRWTVPISGGVPRRLPLGPDATFLIESRDRRWAIRWLSPTVRVPSGSAEVEIVEPSGRSRVIGIADRTPAVLWSPDQTRVALHIHDAVGATEDVAIVDFTTGTWRWLKAPRPSTKDGRFLMSVFGDGAGLWTTKDSIVVRHHLPGAGNDWFLVPATSGTARPLFEGRAAAGGDAFYGITPDETWIAFRKGGSTRLHIRHIATGHEHPLTRGSGDETGILFSPDSRLILFTSNRDGPYGLYVAPLDRTVSEPVRLMSTGTEPTIGAPSGRGWWTPEGRIALRMTYPEHHIYRLDLDPATGRPVEPDRDGDRLSQDTPSNYAPVPSPDGQQIAYWFERGPERAGVAVMRADGSLEQTVFDHALPPLRHRTLAWRSADELLFYEPARSDGQAAGLFVIQMKSRSATRIATLEIPGDWQFVPVSNEVVFSDGELGGEASLKAVSLTSGRTRPIRSEPGLMSFVVSGNGRRIAYAWTPSGDISMMTAFVAIVTGIPVEIRVMSMDGVDEKTLSHERTRLDQFLTLSMPVAFSPDDRLLLLSNSLGASRVVDLETSDSWSVHPGLGYSDWQAAATIWTVPKWSPSGTYLTFSRGGQRETWQRWEGVTSDAVLKLLTGNPARPR